MTPPPAKNNSVRHSFSQSGVFLSLLVAIFGAWWSLRGASQSDLIFPDASRHALNGALILDMVRHHALLRPVAFAREFYSRLPAISIPYHPPLFPLFEASLFAVFGVSPVIARVAVSVCVVVC